MFDSEIDAMTFLPNTEFICSAEKIELTINSLEEEV